MRKALFTGLLVVVWVHAQAAMSAPDAAWQQALAVSCPTLMTEQECNAHRQTLVRISNGADRNAYLAGLAALLRERRKACDCTLLSGEISFMH